MADQKATVTVVISGESRGIQEAAQQAAKALGLLSGEAQKTAASAEGKLRPAAHNAGQEVKGLGERARVAAEMIGLMGAESSEAVFKVHEMSGAFKEMTHTFGGFSGALRSAAGGLIAFGAIDFMKESVEEAMKGQAAWDGLSRAFARNKEGLEEVKGQIEGNQAAWAHFGVVQGQVAAMAQTMATRGFSAGQITDVLGDPSKLADVAAKLHESMDQTIDDLTRPRGQRSVLTRLGLSSRDIAIATSRLSILKGSDAIKFIEDLVAKHGGAGQGEAQAGTAAGSFKAFGAAMGNLKEEVGTALLPVLTSLAQALTTILGALETATKPFGGLANVLKVLFLPMLLLGIKLFLGLRGGLFDLAKLLVDRLVGGFVQTAESMGEADAEAKQLATDVRTIPESWTTTPFFNSAAATGIKDAYKLNVMSIPAEWITKAVFEPAAIADPIEPALDQGAVIAAQAKAEELVAGGVALPMVLAPPTAAEATQVATESRSAINTAWKQVNQGAPAAEMPVMVKLAPGSSPLLVPKLKATGLVVDNIIYTGKPLGTVAVKGGTLPITPVLATDAPAQEQRIRNQIQSGVGTINAKVNVTGATGAVAKEITTAQTYANTHHIKIFADMAKEGATWGAMGLAFQVANLAVTSKVTYVNDQGAPAFKPGSPAAPLVTSPIPVKITNTTQVGQAIDSALVGGKPLPLAAGGKPGAIASIVAVSNWPKITDTKIVGGTTVPLSVKQSGHWKVTIGQFDAAAMGQMILTGVMVSAVMNAWNIVGPKIWGAVRGGLGKLTGALRGAGRDGGPPDEGEPPGTGLPIDIAQYLPKSAPAAAADTGTAGSSLAAGIAGMINKIDWKLAFKTMTLVSLPIAIADLIGHSLKNVNWGSALKNVGSAAGIALGVAAAVGTFIGGAFKLIGSLMQGPSAAPGFSAADLKKAGYVNPAPSFAKFVGDVIGGGIKLAWDKLKDIGAGIIDAIIDGVKHAWAKLPGVIPWIFGGDRPEKGKLSIGGKNYDEYIKKGDKPPAAPAGYKYVAISNKPGFAYELEETTKHGNRPIGGGFTGRFGGIGGGLGLGDLTGQLDALIQGQAGPGAGKGTGTAPGKAAPAGHTTFNATFHINGAKDPHAVATQIEKALEQFVAGAKSQRRLAG